MNIKHRMTQITLPSLSFKEREIAYVKIVGEMHRSDRVDRSDDGRAAATVCKVVNLQDGVEYRLICPSLMVSALSDEGTEYVGKCYEILVSSKPLPGKQYKGVEVYEIDPKGDYTDFPIRVEDEK